MYFKKARGENRVAKLIDSPCMPEGDCMFALSEGGITDAND